MKKIIAVAALLFCVALPAFAASIPLYTGPAGTNPIGNPAILGDINSLVNSINNNTVLTGSQPFTPPNVFPVCGSDSTLIIQGAVNNSTVNLGTIALPPCTAAQGCFVISATILVPSNVSILGTGRSVTCLKAAANLNGPIFENANNGGAGGITLNSNIEIGFLTIDGNGSNQSHVLQNYCIYMLGVDRPSVHDMEIDNCDSTAIHFDGNSSTTTNGGFVNNIFINTTFGTGSNPLSGVGLKVSNAQRGMQVANVTTLNTAGYGVLLDASEGNWSSIHTKGSGTGLICPNSGITTVNNPGGGGVPQSSWTPCAAGIYVRNVSDVTGTGFIASEGQYYGMIITGCRHCTFNGIVATDNSLKTNNVWDDLHLDLNIFLTSGRGENHNLTIDGVVVGANGELNTTNASSAPTSRYGLFINDGIAGSAGDAAIISGGSGYTAGDSLTTVGGTQSITAKWTAGNVVGGIITGIKHDFSGGSGVYTVLPTSPVSLSGGTGSGATLSILWSVGSITGVTIGQTITAPFRIPAFHTGWTIQTNQGSFDQTGLPTLSACGGGSPSMATNSTSLAGTLTAGTATGTCTMTFATLAQGTPGFTTYNQCLFQSPATMTGFAYSYTLTSGIITAGALGSAKVDYRCSGQ